MRLLRIALAQLNPTVGDLDGNFEKAAGAIARARDLGADVLALPEMMITGYPPEDLLLKPSFIERALERTRDLVPLSAGLTVIDAVALRPCGQCLQVAQPCFGTLAEFGKIITARGQISQHHVHPNAVDAQVGQPL